MELVYEGRVFSVEVGERRFADGRQHRVEIVRHAPSVVIIPIETVAPIVTGRQFREPLDGSTFECPAGRVEAGESPEDAVRRECEEETGRVPELVERIRGLYPAPGFCDEELIFFRASSLRPPSPDSKRKPDEDEDIETQVVSV